MGASCEAHSSSLWVSGHSSSAFAGLGFLSLYLAAKFHVFNNEGHTAPGEFHFACLSHFPNALRSLDRRHAPHWRRASIVAALATLLSLEVDADRDLEDDGLWVSLRFRHLAKVQLFHRPPSPDRCDCGQPAGLHYCLLLLPPCVVLSCCSISLSAVDRMHSLLSLAVRPAKPRAAPNPPGHVQDGGRACGRSQQQRPTIRDVAPAHDFCQSSPDVWTSGQSDK